MSSLISAINCLDNSYAVAAMQAAAEEVHSFTHKTLLVALLNVIRTIARLSPCGARNRVKRRVKFSSRGDPFKKSSSLALEH